MSKLLIIGASVLQLPAIIKAKELGHYVAVADFNSKAVGIPYADQYFNASTIDEEAILGVAKKFKPDGIMTLATDMPMRSIAKATAELGLSGISYETAIKSTDKGKMIEAFKVNNVSSPWYYILNSVNELEDKVINYPCIIKPTDNAGSRGVILVNSSDKLYDSFLYSQSQSRSGSVILEEYMQGPEVSVEVMVVKGEAHVLAITDKLTTGAPYFVEMGHSQPSNLDFGIQEEIIKLTKKAVEAVGINCGPAHVEMIITSQGPKMVELGARMGGDCITTHLVPLSTGIDMIKATIDTSLGLIPDITPKFTKSSAIRFLNADKGIISSIKGVESAMCVDGIKEIVLSKKEGDVILEIKSSLDRTGFIISQSNDPISSVRICEEAAQHIDITIL